MSDIKANVLIVDDSDSNLDVLSRRILRLGHKPFIAVDGSQAMQFLLNEHIDLVLLDIMMPNMNGYQVLTRIKDDPELRHIPVIVISAIEDISSTVKCIELGAEDYLTKPFNPLILQARITASLEKKRLRDLESDYLEEQSVSQRVSRELNARLNFRTMSEIALSWAMARSEAHLGLIGRIMPEEDSMEVMAIDSQSPVSRTYQNQTLNIESEEFQRAIKTFMPQVSNGQVSYLLPESESRFVFPIGRPGQVIALLVLENNTPDHYSKSTLSFLTMLTDRAGTAMLNAYLFEEVQRANQAKTEFISDVSHELKNPMTNILNYSKLIAHAGELSKEQKSFLRTIVDSVHRMRRLVSDLSDISRIEAGHLQLEIEPVDVRELIETASDELRGRLTQKEQTLKIKIEENLPKVKADRNRIVQVLVNLISNAHKYTEEGGAITVVARMAKDDLFEQKSAASPQPMAMIAIIDNGIG
ncbi:MAG: response regulator, partial [Chloroflexota bacterium]